MRAAAVLVAILALTAPAGAQPGNSDFRAGVRAARERRWEEARDAFERAHRRDPSADTLFNLAGAEAQTGRLRAAAGHYREFLQSEPAPEEATLTAARQMISAIEARLARVRIAVTDARAGDVVRLDGEAVAPTSEAIPIEAGAHRLTLERDGAVVAEASVQLGEGQLGEAALAAPAPSPPVLRAAPVQDDPVDEGPAEAGGAFPWGWVGAGAGVVVLVVVLAVVLSSDGAAEPTQGSLGRVGVELGAW